MLQKDITEKFSVIKGSTPVRLDASVGIDKHAKMVLAAIADPKFGHPVRNITMDDDFAGAYMALADAFLEHPEHDRRRFHQAAAAEVRPDSREVGRRDSEVTSL